MGDRGGEELTLHQGLANVFESFFNPFEAFVALALELFGVGGELSGLGLGLNEPLGHGHNGTLNQDVDNLSPPANPIYKARLETPDFPWSQNLTKLATTANVIKIYKTTR